MEYDKIKQEIDKLEEVYNIKKIGYSVKLKKINDDR